MHVRLTEKNPQLVAEQQWLVAITTTTYYITSFLLLLFGSLFKLQSRRPMPLQRAQRPRDIRNQTIVTCYVFDALGLGEPVKIKTTKYKNTTTSNRCLASRSDTMLTSVLMSQ